LPGRNDVEVPARKQRVPKARATLKSPSNLTLLPEHPQTTANIVTLWATQSLVTVKQQRKTNLLMTGNLIVAKQQRRTSLLVPLGSNRERTLRNGWQSAVLVTLLPEASTPGDQIRITILHT
jgi:hypothetical protein